MKREMADARCRREQEMADVLEKLLIGYLKDNKLLDKKGGG